MQRTKISILYDNLKDFRDFQLFTINDINSNTGIIIQTVFTTVNLDIFIIQSQL